MKKTFFRLGLFCVMAFSLFVLETSASKQGKGTSTAVQIKPEGRQALRAFYTAPPVIPHEVTDAGNKECLFCHQEVLKVAGRTSVKTPHPEFSNCQQCHVQGARPIQGSVATSWQGLEEPKKGTRAHIVAPPTIPHRLFLRNNCLSCHGPKNPDVRLRVRHPERSNCLQCHVLKEGVEF